MDKVEAIKILKDFHDESAIFSVRTALETLHPELKESEDERIRKKLISFVENWSKKTCDYKQPPHILWTSNKEECAKILSWLKKQGQPRMQYGITINGVEYELIKDDGADECERCALHEKCHYSNEVICTQLFENSSAHHRFEKR